MISWSSGAGIATAAPMSYSKRFLPQWWKNGSKLLFSHNIARAISWIREQRADEHKETKFKCAPVLSLAVRLTLSASA